MDRVNVSVESDNAAVRKLLLSMDFRVIDTFVFADKPNDLLARELGGNGAGSEKEIPAR